MLIFSSIILEYIDSFAETHFISVGILNIAINEFHVFPIMLALCLMLSVTYYAQNYAG